MINAVEYKGYNSLRGPSPIIWADCPIAEFIEDPNKGLYFFDDFMSFPPHGSTSGGAVSGALGQYSHYVYQGGAIAPDTVQGTGLAFSSDGDNEGAALHTYSAPFYISSSYKKLWFEARVKCSTIADTKHGMFIGLAESLSLSTAQPIATDGTIMDKNLIGFHRLEADGAHLDVIFKNSGQTQNSLATDAFTLVADTYVKVGFVFDPDAAAANQITFYFNGTPITTFVTSTLRDAATFPNDTPLGLVFGVMNATGTTPGSSTIDWWRAAQQI